MIIRPRPANICPVPRSVVSTLRNWYHPHWSFLHLQLNSLPTTEIVRRARRRRLFSFAPRHGYPANDHFHDAADHGPRSYPPSPHRPSSVALQSVYTVPSTSRRNRPTLAPSCTTLAPTPTARIGSSSIPPGVLLAALLDSPPPFRWRDYNHPRVLSSAARRIPLYESEATPALLGRKRTRGRVDGISSHQDIG